MSAVGKSLRSKINPRLTGIVVADHNNGLYTLRLDPPFDRVNGGRITIALEHWDEISEDSRK